MPCPNCDNPNCDAGIKAGPSQKVWVCNDINIELDEDALALAIALAIEAALADELAGAFDPANFSPNPAGTYQTLTYTVVAAPFAGAIDAATTHVKVRFETADARVTFDGTTVAVSGVSVAVGGVGTPYYDGDSEWWEVAALTSASFVSRIGGGTGYLHISEWMAP